MRQETNKQIKYEQAFQELQTIVRRMENDELDIDQMTDQLKRAQELIRLCKDKLTKTDEEIKKLLAEE
jgi:exodeoxyribonuclease VII small subunit